MERPPSSTVALNAPRYDIYFVLYSTLLYDTILSEIVRQDNVNALNEYLLFIYIGF